MKLRKLLNWLALCALILGIVSGTVAAPPQPVMAGAVEAPAPNAAPRQDVLYFWDFEGDDGGFGHTLDWEWGTYAWHGTGCYNASNVPPPAAYSGTNMWGTVLNTCYSDLGNHADPCANVNPNDDSILSLTIDLTGVVGDVELSWWEWYDLFGYWDWAEVRVEGDVVWQNCEDHVAPTAWEQQTVDLAPYVGGPVTIEFHMMASTVVNYAGWYIDDVMVTGQRFSLDAWKEAPATAEHGDVISYTITLSATELLAGTFMADPLPAGVGYAGNLTYTTGTAWYSDTVNTVFWEYVEEPRAPAAPRPAAVDESLNQPAPVIAPSSGGAAVPFGGGSTMTILDDFNRADGPIGPDWTVHDGYCNVSNNAAVCGSFGRATFNGAPGDGNVAEADIATNGTSSQYTGLLLNYGAGNTNLFLKVQQQDGSGQFHVAGCYIGNNQNGFGLGFFTLDAPFSTAHMRATRVGSDVTIEFTNIDGGGGSQTYVCSGAPAPEGTGIGILGWNGSARLDNFGLPGEEAEQVQVTFDMTVTGHCGDVIVNEGVAGYDTLVEPFTATTVVEGEPALAVSPPLLDAALCPDTTGVQTLTICNEGDCPLTWELHEMTPTLRSAGTPVAPQVTLPDGVPPSLSEFVASGQPAFTVQPVAPTVPTAVPEALTYYATRAEFDTDYPGLPVEGYENGSMAPGTIDDIPHPLDEFSSNAYFDPGDILPGIQFWATVDQPTDDEIAVLGAGFAGNPDKTAVANYFTDGYRIVFDPPVQAAGMDLQDLMGSGSCQVDIYDTNGYLTSVTSTCDAAGVFWGVASDADPIAELVITDLGGGAEGVDNIAFGDEPFVYPDFPWISEDPISGTVPWGECQDVEVTFDATGLAPGDQLFADLLILSNDPETPEVLVPTTMTVLEPLELVSVTYTVDDLQVTFDATVSGTEPISFTWDFDDGNMSAEEDPVHVYAEGGCYTVTLTVENPCGMEDWIEQITVETGKHYLYLPIVVKD